MAKKKQKMYRNSVRVNTNFHDIKLDKSKVMQPCFGFFLRGSVKETAIANAFVAVANMIIFLAGILEFLPRKDEVEPNCGGATGLEEDMKSAIRYVFWAIYYLYWAIDIYLSLILFSASKKHNERACLQWLIIQVFCFVIFLVLFLLHCFWMCGFNVILEVLFGVICMYKVYTFWVVYSFYKRLRTTSDYMNHIMSQLPDAVLEDFDKGNLHVPLGERHSSVTQQNPYNKSFEISMNDINDKVEWIPIGEGEFGIVYKAIYHRPNIAPIFVAVKTIRSELEFFKTQLCEFKIRTEIGDHPNIVALIGANTTNIKNRELELIVEFCPFGSLESFLQTRRGLFMNQIDSAGNIKDAGLIPRRKNAGYALQFSPEQIKTTDLVRWALQIARGMEHLKQNNVIHGDLAARNVLLSADKIAKINDFGLSKQCYSYRGYVRSKQKSMPWRQMSPECFGKTLTFSYESDIWAYGITLWEIFSMGDQPFAHLEEPSHHFLESIRKGNVLPRPLYAPNEVYEVMQLCWNPNPKERPSFREIATKLNGILEAILMTTFVRKESGDDSGIDARADTVVIDMEGAAAITIQPSATSPVCMRINPYQERNDI